MEKDPLQSHLTGVMTDSQFKDKVEALSVGDAEAALQKFRQNLRQSQQKGDRLNIANALFNIALVFRGQRQYNTALKLLEDVKATYESLNHQAGVASVYQELAYANRELQRNAIALEYAHQAVKIFQRLGYTLELAWVYDNLTVIYFNLYHWHESLTYAKKARAIFLEFNSQTGVAWNGCNLASLYWEMAFYQRAERHCMESLTIFTQLKNKQGMAWSLFWLGMIHRVQCRFDSAQDYLVKAKKILEELKLKDRVGWCLLNEAAIKRAVGNQEDAILINKRAIQLFGPLRNHDGVAWGLFQIGQILRDRGQYIKAWQTFREALNFHTDIASRKGMGWTENDWGKTYLEISDQAHALECFVKAKVIADQLDEALLKVEVDKNLANVYLEEGFLQKAAGLLEHCEERAKKIQARDLEVEVLLSFGRYYLILGDLQSARQYGLKAQDLIETYNLHRLKPALQVFLGETEILSGRQQNGIDLWKDVLALSKKFQQRRQQTEALLGLTQIFLKQGQTAQIPAMIGQIEKDVRALSSRKIKAKYLLVKSLLYNPVKKAVDIKSLSQADKILEASGLVVLQYQTLSLISEFCQRVGEDKEKRTFDNERQELLNRSSVDLKRVFIERGLGSPLPISIVI